MKVFKQSLLLTLVALLIGGATWTLAEEKPLATGDGFVLMPAEVDEICAQSKPSWQQLTGGQCLNLALRLTLFAKEAERMGLGEKEKSGRPERMSIDRLKELSDLYRTKLVDDFPVKDIVIESYYWAHPKQFRVTGDSKSAAGLKSLNGETKKMIRQKILSKKLPAIEKEAVTRLMASYHVKITDGKKGVAGEKDS